ncbi:ArsB/NhaD family transporter [Cytobacillus sp. S13-E01]|uniref:ArsB/NhaD family transporter n=1 Tax=Cytobacillus sp. S13-E01 TaxID=3031326 RepID=UPI0023D7BB45|nr:ArsB/NhaD family transporter [Cytobacillus sp. S13-E01]MDF0726796.1 ArsB/NhaD family transporter [Cytobacillus sp. S13-E01]
MTIVLALLIFIISYLVIMTEKLDRALIACIGGVMMLLVGIYDIDSAFLEYIDWSTITLLFSMMIIVTITSQTGVFEFVAIVVAKLVKGKGIPLLFVVSLLTAIGSAFLANVTTVLLLVPIILTLVRILEVPAVPFLIAIILSSNIGGTATLIGDPPNIMIGQAVEHLTFNAFLFNLSPIVLLIFIVIIGGLALLYWNKLHVTPTNQKRLKDIEAISYLKKDQVLYKSVGVLLLTVVGFILHPFLHVDLTSVAMAGALLLLLLTHEQYKPDDVFKQVDWGTLFFFIGLFLLVGGLEEVGIIDEMARGILYYTEGDLPKTALLVLWLTGLLSGFVDNIPFVAAMIPVIFEFQDYGMTNLDPLWWSLALGACLGGNGTLLGSSSNLVVAGLAAKAKEQVNFIEFLKIGIPVVVVSLLLSTIYVYFRYLVDFI